MFVWQGLRPRPLANDMHGLNFQFPRIPLHPSRMMGTATLSAALALCLPLAEKPQDGETVPDGRGKL